MTPAQLRERRDKLGLTQAELAQRLAVNRVTLARWETDALPIPPYLALALDAIEAAS